MRPRVLLDIVRARRAAFAAVLLLIIADAGIVLYRSYVQGPRLETLYATWSQKRRTLAAKPPGSEAEIYRRNKADLAVFNATIPPKREFVRLVGDLYETATNNGLKVGSIVYKPSLVKGQPLYDFTVTVAVAGRYAGIKSFIGDVARSRDMLVIDSVSLNNSSAEEESVGMRMDITAYMKQEGQ
jgi:type IV pilus assembly protein PilO